MTTLIVAPHPDDEVLGCFAFLGPDACVLFAGLGTTDAAEALIRQRELEMVAEKAGHRWQLLDLETNRYRASDLVGPIERAVNREQAERVLLPARSYHQDHRAVHDAGIAALRPHDHNHGPTEVLIYEQPQVALWPIEPFSPGLFMPIDVDAKIDIYRLYRSQLRRHRSEKVVRALATLRGAQADVEAAEGFAVLRMVRPDTRASAL